MRHYPGKPIKGPKAESGPTGKLSAHERERLAACELAVRQHLDGWVAAGMALVELRESRLYRETHATLEDYCENRFGRTRRRLEQIRDAAQAKQLIDSDYRRGNKVGTNRSDLLPKLTLENEWQARALIAAVSDPAKYCDVMDAAYEATEGKVTAKAITEAARKIAPKKKTEKKDSKPHAPKNKIAEWTARFDRMEEAIASACRELVALAAEPCGRWLRIYLDDSTSALTGDVVCQMDEIIHLIHVSAPDAECTKCKGKGKGCRYCDGQGWTTRAMR